MGAHHHHDYAEHSHSHSQSHGHGHGPVRHDRAFTIGTPLRRRGGSWRAPPPPGLAVSAVSGLGMLVNGFTAWPFAGDRHTQVNIRGACLHMAADALVSPGWSRRDWRSG